MPGFAVTVVIVTYNSRDVVAKCLDNLINPGLRLLVIDNASTDGTPEFISSRYSSVEIIKYNKNIGYGRAANIGLKTSKTKYTLLLNPDVITSAEAIIGLLIRSNDFKNAVMFAPSTRKDKRATIAEQKVGWVSGAAILFDMEKLAKIGFFDENIFLFYEETDLCRRAKQKGYDIILFNDIYFEHLVGKSSSPDDKITYMKYWHMAWSRFYYNQKHESNFEFLRKTVGYLLKFTFKYAIYILSRNKEKKIKYRASLAGSVSYLFGLKAFDTNNNPRALKT